MPENLQNGRYHGILSEAVTGESQTGSPQVVLTFNLTHRLNDANEWEPVDSIDRRVYLSLHDNAWQYSQQKLAAIGFNGDFADPKFADEVYAEGIDLIASDNTYNGKTSQRWELADWGGGAVKPAGDDKIRRLNALWKAKHGTSPRPAGKPAVPLPAPAAPAAAPADSAPGGGDVATKDDAWKVWCKVYADAPDLAEWNKAIAERGKPGSAFTADDWLAVADMACPIF